MSLKIDDIEIRLLLEAIFQKYHYDFRGYSMASVKRRLNQARDRFGCATFSQLQDRVLHDATVFPALLSFLTVQVSELFRDPAYFRTIRESVVPHLRTYPSLKVWVAGCSAGEELYSLAILFREEGLEERTLFYGTDINPDALKKAEAGVYELERIPLFTENHRKSGGALLALMNKLVSKFLIKKDAAKSRLKSRRIIGLNEKRVNLMSSDVHVAVKGACDYWCGSSHRLNENNTETLST